MLFRNSIRLLMENFKNTYKILLYKFIISLIAGALYCAMILPELIEIINSSAMQELIAQAKLLVSAFFEADASALSEAKNAIFGAGGILRDLTNVLLSQLTPIIFAVIGCIVVYLLKRFADTLCYFSVGSIINDKMSTYAETPFFTSYIANLGKASLYAVVYVPVAFLLDVLTIGGILLLVSTVQIFPALFFSMVILVVMQSIKLTITWLWMPSLTTDNKKLRECFRYEDKIEKKQISKIFATYIVDVYLVIIVNVISAICTFGSALIITVPASYLFFVCQQYVNYYTLKGKKYFITYDRIATNPDRGDREHFFDYIDDTAPNASEVSETKDEK